MVTVSGSGYRNPTPGSRCFMRRILRERETRLTFIERTLLLEGLRMGFPIGPKRTPGPKAALVTTPGKLLRFRSCAFQLSHNTRRLYKTKIT